MAQRSVQRNLPVSLVAGAVPQQQRVMRRPAQTFNIRSKPWEITPFMIAPVLPGETMKNLLLQARVITDPVINRLTGWWKEYYFFYIRHRDLDDSAELQAMMLDAEYDLSPKYAAAAAKYYHHAGTYPWVEKCLKRVVEEFFRDEGETWNTNLVTNYPAASIMGPSRPTWLDSVVNDSAVDAPDDVEVTIGVDDKIKASEMQEAMRSYDFFRHNKLTEMSYEDYLATFGVRLPDVEDTRPELVRYVRSWAYPVSAIDPADGSAASAVTWSIAERADKDRFFKEPGFVFGVTVARPKVYLGKQNAAAVGLLRNAFAWLPALMREDFMASFQKVTNGANGPLSGNTEPYWVDVRDIFLYGDQFVNFDISTDATGTAIASPTAALQKKYPDQTAAHALMVDATNFPYVREDGVVSLSILGTQVDRT